MTMLRGRLGELDTSSVDGNSILRTSRQQLLFDSSFDSDTLPGSWDTVVVGGGSAVHVPTDSTVKMSVGTAAGDKVTRHTRRWMFFQLGRSNEVKLDGLMGPVKANVVHRVGIWDDVEGFYFERDINGVRIVIKSVFSSDVIIEQANWNIDPHLPGSDYPLDTTKHHSFAFDVQNLRFGQIRFGFVRNGVTAYVHSVDNRNTEFMHRFCKNTLPFKYELENTGVTASATDYIQTVCTHFGESGDLSYDMVGTLYSAGTGPTGRTISVNTELPLISIRLKDQINGKKNRRSAMPLLSTLFSKTADSYWKMYLNAQLTGAVWTDVGNGSACDYDISATSYVGGRKLIEGYIDKTGKIVTDEYNSKLFMSTGELWNDSLTFVLQPLTVSADLLMSVMWKEIF